MSRQKEVILGVLRAQRFHPTADEILLRARQRMPALALGTVYRNLKALCDEKKVRRIPMEDAPDRYDGFVEPHDHLVCTVCGKKIEFVNDSIEKLQEEVCREHSFKPTAHHMVLYGICKDCR